MATIRLVPSSYSLSNTQYLSISNPGNMYTDTDSTTYAVVTNTRNSTTNTYYLYIRGFNFDAVPANATVNSFTVKIKGNETNLNTANTYYSSLINNTTGIAGSAATFNTTVTVREFSGVTAAWDTIKGYGANFGIRVQLRRNSTGSTSSANIYGAEIEVNYIIPHNITAVSNTDLATVSPQTQQVDEGSDATVMVFTNQVDDISVDDNGSDVTTSLVYHAAENNLTSSLYAVSATASGTVYSSSATGQASTAYRNCIGVPAETSTTVTTGACVYRPSAQSTNTTIDYTFDFSSIPQNATVQDVSVTVRGLIESTSQTNRKAGLKLFAGSTQKGSESNFTSTTTSTLTMTAGTWTREELNDAILRFEIGVYGGYIVGITFSVTYSVPAYYAYTINNVTQDHIVTVSESEIITPDEDPTKTYYSITVSSINATTDPKKGTTRVESGTGQTITITPSDPQLTLALDNGVDVTSQLVQHGVQPSSSITTAQGASYGFVYNASTGYYTSQNSGVSNSAAVARVSFNLPVRSLITLEYINYAESPNYDYGIFGNIDTTLGTTYSADNASLVYKSCAAATDNSPDPKTLTYEIPAGNHFIDIKYRKDAATNSYNDNLQFKILQIEELEVNLYYTYSLSNINTNHSLVFIFGNVTYYFVTSSTNSHARLYPDGQMVQLPGDTYRLTIVPENTGDTVSVTDNNVDVTDALVKKEETVQKEGSAITVVNYIYTLSNVQTGHTIVVSSILSSVPYVKVNGNWTQLTAIYKKIDGRWQLQNPDTDIFDDGEVYVRN